MLESEVILSLTVKVSAVGAHVLSYVLFASPVCDILVPKSVRLRALAVPAEHTGKRKGCAHWTSNSHCPVGVSSGMGHRPAPRRNGSLPISPILVIPAVLLTLR